MKETLEEASERYANTHQDVSATLGKYLVKSVFQDGAKYQQERMYSEEEVIELLTKRCEYFGTSVSPFDKILLKQDLEWFNEFKKK
jgi:hypothetical protein